MNKINFYLEVSEKVLDEKYGNGYSKLNPNFLMKIMELSLNHDIETQKIKMEKERNEAIISIANSL